MSLSKGKRSLLFILSLLTLDQFVKFLVKTNMKIGESIPVFGKWFQICFVENFGMAFGIQFGGVAGKIILTLVRIILIALIGYYLHTLIKRDQPMGVILGISLIFVGAIGNVIDSLFYGMLFSASTTQTVAQFLPSGGGYAPFLQGRVVDMLYFPLIDTTLPKWVPFWGGEPFQFFRPIFNVADSCITIGVFYLLLFQRKFLSNEKLLK